MSVYNPFCLPNILPIRHPPSITLPPAQDPAKFSGAWGLSKQAPGIFKNEDFPQIRFNIIRESIKNAHSQALQDPVNQKLREQTSNSCLTLQVNSDELESGNQWPRSRAPKATCASLAPPRGNLGAPPVPTWMLQNPRCP